MTHTPRAPAPARLLAVAYAMAAPAQAFAVDSDPTPPAIVVTARRLGPIENPPATIASVDAARLADTTAVINPEDALRYLPSLLVRKRHVGDTQAPLATRTSGVGASARSLIYADGVLLSALIGNNNSTASPRWGMISPEEIERVDVLYGPFSAAYPGNSIGAVVNVTTRLPQGFEATASAATSVQTFDQYATHGTYPAYQLAATAGDRHGAFAWFVSADHVASRSQPLATVTITRPSATGAAGTAATGAFPDFNRAGAPIFVIGAGGFEDQLQDNFKLKLALDLSPALRLIYRGGLFLNDTKATAQTYLTAGGASAYAGTFNIGGRSVSVPAAAFSNNVYRYAERHWMHALTAEGSAGRLDWQAVASLYDFARDVQRIPSAALPAALVGGAGSIVRLDGTGWRTLDLKGRWRSGEAHDFSFGAHHDRFVLASNRYATADWLRGQAGARNQAARGRTRTQALWAQDAISLGRGFELTLGGRYEWWRADRGFNFSLAPALSVQQPARTAQGLSPKASLKWEPAPAFNVTASAGQAYRFPTVSELYQAIGTGPSITVPDPSLRPERARSEELAIEWTPAQGRARLSLFNERIRDALIAQTAPLLPGSGTLFSYVQNVPLVRTRGLELVLDGRDLLVPGLELSGSVTLADPKVVRNPAFAGSQGKDLPQVPRRRATMVLTYRPAERAALTLAARYSSRAFGTIDNSDPVTHTYQGFDAYLVFDARAHVRVTRRLDAAFGVENIGNDKYFIFHPFPQRTLTGEVSFRW